MIAEGREWLWEEGTGGRREPPGVGYGRVARVNSVLREGTGACLSAVPAAGPAADTHGAGDRRAEDGQAAVKVWGFHPGGRSFLVDGQTYKEVMMMPQNEVWEALREAREQVAALMGERPCATPLWQTLGVLQRRLYGYPSAGKEETMQGLQKLRDLCVDECAEFAPAVDTAVEVAQRRDNW